MKKLNPNAEGELEIWDNDVQVKLNVIEKDGKKVLDVKRIKSEAPKIKPNKKENNVQDGKDKEPSRKQ